MTVATLLFTCLIFLVTGRTGPAFYVTALSIGGIVCIASSNGGTTSQDLKTGFLVGATPKFQQIAILIGAAASALVLGSVLLKLNDVATVYVPAERVTAQTLIPKDSLRTLKTEVYPPPDGIVVKAMRWLGLKNDSEAGEPKNYFVWYAEDTSGGDAKKYLVDETGKAIWFVDPG